MPNISENSSPSFNMRKKETLEYIEIIKQEINRSLNIMTDFLEFSKIEDTPRQNLWDTMKAVVRRKLISLSASKKKLKIEPHSV